MANLKKICVVGAGIIGFPTAVCIQDMVPDAQVTVMAELFSPDTTGDGAAGFWMPHFLGDVPKDVMRQWAVDTWDRIAELNQSEIGGEIGSQLVSGYVLLEEEQPWMDCADLMLGFRDMNERELALFPDFKQGWTFTTYTLESWKYLPWIKNIFLKNGGKVQQRKLQSLQEVYADFDVIVNCSGNGAYHLVNDKEMVPVRGQTIRVEAPWQKHFVLINDAEYFIFPCHNFVTLGNTHQRGNTNLTPDPEDRDRIWETCCKLVPSIRKSKVIKEWVGLRPYRSSVRLEREVVHHGGRSVQLVHNYGHGGSGITLHWGCGLHAARLVKEALGTTATGARL